MAETRLSDGGFVAQGNTWGTSPNGAIGLSGGWQMSKNANKHSNMSSVERRRLAVQVVSMLPDDRDDALAILTHALELVRFIHAAEGAAIGVAEVQRLRAV